MALKNWGLDQIIGQLNSGTKWNVAPGGTITWGTPARQSDYYKLETWVDENGNSSCNWEIYGFQALNSTQTSVAARSLNLWSDVANIKFEFSASTTTKPDITFQNSTYMGKSYAWAYYPGPENYSMAGSVWFNSSRYYEYSSELQNPSLTDINTGGWSNMAFIHEIGHALGLDHMGNYNGGSPTYAKNASCVEDSMLYSIMSYFTPWESKQADWRASDGKYYVCQTPMMNDIAAMKEIYGANENVRTTDTVYGFNSTSALDNVYNFNINKHPVLCLYDSGGIDRLDLSGFRSNSNVNLLAGSFSSCDMMTKNISIARNVIIENATTGAGNDTLSGNAIANRLDGGAGNDTLDGIEGDDTLLGGAGNDNLDGGSGNDTLDGGLGNDLYFMDSKFDVIAEAAGQGIDTVLSTASVTLAMIGEHVENITLRSRAPLDAQGNGLNNIIKGNTADNRLSGGAGNDRLDGSSGNDTLDGGTGNDILTGGTGNDVYYIDTTGDRLLESRGGGTDTIISTISVTSAMMGLYLENITLAGEAAISASGNAASNRITGNDAANALSGNSSNDKLYGGLGNDRLYGGSGNDTLDGGAGDERLYGSTGNDTLNGATGNDFMYGGTGNDIYVVDSSGDRMSEGTSQGTDTVQAWISITAIQMGTNVENIRLMGTDALSAQGNARANAITGNCAANLLYGEVGGDQLYGMEGADQLFGGSGNDRLDGGAGADSLDGGTGNDIFVFDNEGDSAIEAAAQGTDTIEAWVITTAAANIENIVLKGTAIINATGNELANSLIGNAAANTLDGGLGRDSLTGGAGRDIFQFSTALGAGNIDTIRDFSVKDDTIRLDHEIFKEITMGQLTAAAFRKGTAFDADDRILYNAQTGGLWYDQDGSGTEFAAVQFAILAKNLSLSAADFVII